MNFLGRVSLRALIHSDSDTHVVDFRGFLDDGKGAAGRTDILHIQRYRGKSITHFVLINVFI